MNKSKIISYRDNLPTIKIDPNSDKGKLILKQLNSNKNGNPVDAVQLLNEILKNKLNK